MKKKSSIFEKTFFYIIVGFFIFSTSHVLASEKTYEFTVGHGSSSNIAMNPAWKIFKEKVETRSNGKIKIEIFGAGAICNEGPCGEQLGQGSLDFASLSTGNWGAFTDTLYTIDMPYVFKTYEHAKRAITGSVGDILKKRSEEKDDVKLLAIISSYGYRNLYNNVKEVRVPDDLKGIKIRTVLSPIEQNLVKSWGATPLNVPWGELYQSLETKIVNGFYVPDGWIYNYKLHEVAPYVTETGGLFNWQIMLMRLDRYEELTDELKKVIDIAAKETELETWEIDYKWGQEIKGKMEKEGVKFYKPTPDELKQWESVKEDMLKMFKNQIDQELLKEIDKYHTSK